ncbi:MAG TPA: hypothetical protein VG675_08680 [Bryobacteraceae bacterium]|nr:hypothetical protein [Bryobacteraceae bacterium]
MRLLVVASEPREFSGLLAQTAGAEKAALAVDWARRVRFGGHEAVLIANGIGRERAAAAVDAACEALGADAVVSTGFCGALAPELGVAEVVVATEIEAPERRYTARPVECGRAHRSGMVCSVDRVARTVREKQRLHATGGIAVEMEAAGIAERAEMRGLPFYCVRAVTDLAGESLANDFNAALRSNGHFDTMRILRGAFRQPWVCVPELIRLRERCVRAADTLGEFFADCRF